MLFFLFWLFSARAEAIPVWADPKYSRQEQLQSCVRCHGEQHKQWSDGPHAVANQKLIEYRDDFVKHLNIDEAERTRVHAVISDGKQCSKCHSPENLYDTVYKNGYKIESTLTVFATPRPAARRGTSVDCMTCHVQGRRVIAGEGFKPKANAFAKKDPDFCDPKALPEFSQSAMCAACHVSVFEQKVMAAELGQLGKTSCVKCHMEAPGGRQGHQEWWKWNLPVEFALWPSYQKKTYQGIKLSFDKKDGRERLNLRWKNDFAPHELLPSGPRVVIVQLSLRDGGADVPIGKFRLVSTEVHGMALKIIKDGFDVFKPLETLEKSFDLPPTLKARGAVRLTFRTLPYFEYPEAEAKTYLELEVVPTSAGG